MLKRLRELEVAARAVLFRVDFGIDVVTTNDKGVELGCQAELGCRPCFPER